MSGDYWTSFSGITDAELALLAWPPSGHSPTPVTVRPGTAADCHRTEEADRIESWRTPAREILLDARTGQYIPRRPLATELAASVGR